MVDLLAGAFGHGGAEAFAQGGHGVKSGPIYYRSLAIENC